MFLQMHQILQVRLAAAENEIKSVEQEKIEKQRFAQKALSEHEMDMKKVLREANILKQQAEENAKVLESSLCVSISFLSLHLGPFDR